MPRLLATHDAALNACGLAIDGICWLGMFYLCDLLRHRLGGGEAGSSWVVCAVQFAAIILCLYLVGGYDRRTNFISLNYMSEHCITLVTAAVSGALVIYVGRAFGLVGTWRHLEVARWKIRYEQSLSVEQIAAASGCRNFHRFRHQFRHRFGLWPEGICRKNSREELSARELAPFWHWSYPESLYIREAAMASLNRSYNAQYPRRERRCLKREDLIWSGHA